MLDDDELTIEVVVIEVVIKVVGFVLVEEIFAQESLKMFRVFICYHI